MVQVAVTSTQHVLRMAQVAVAPSMFCGLAVGYLQALLNFTVSRGVEHPGQPRLWTDHRCDQICVGIWEVVAL